MASQFKNRLVGVTIVVASVIIFLPSIIDGKKTVYEDEFIATPIKPQIKEHTQVIAPVVDESELATKSGGTTKLAVATIEAKTDYNPDWEIQEIAPVVTVEPIDDEVPEIVKIAKIETPKVVKQIVPEKAWTIQLGAFQNAANINQLLKELHKAGFQAHTVPTEVIDGELTRVFVGPDVSKTKLEKQLPQLNHLTKLQGKLIPFNAVNP